MEDADSEDVKLCIVKNGSNEAAIKLYEECKKNSKFSKVFLADLSKFIARIEKEKILISYKEGELDYNIYFLRTDPEEFPFNYLIASVLEKNGCVVIPSSNAILNCSNKCLIAKMLHDFNFEQPTTYFSFSPETAKRIATNFAKVVLKFSKHGGKGTTILENKSNVSEFIDIFGEIAKPYCLQEFVEGEVIKNLVIADLVFSIKEYPKDGENRSNIAKKRELIKLSQQTNENLISISDKMQAYCCEIDLIESNKKYYVIDISLNPNLEMYAKITGTNIYKILATYLSEFAVKRKKMEHPIIRLIETIFPIK